MLDVRDSHSRKDSAMENRSDSLLWTVVTFARFVGVAGNCAGCFLAFHGKGKYCFAFFVCFCVAQSGTKCCYHG